MNAKQWVLLAITPLVLALANFFMFSSNTLLGESVIWFSIGVALFLLTFTIHEKTFSLSKQGFTAGVLNLTATLITFFLYSFNFLTNVFPFIAASAVLFFAIDVITSRNKVNFKMIAGVAVVFTGLAVTQVYNLTLKIDGLTLGLVLMVIVALTDFLLLHGLNKKNLPSRIQSFTLPFLLTLILFLPLNHALTRVNLNAVISGFLMGAGFLLLCKTLIEINENTLWSRNLVNLTSYTDLIILNILAVLAFQQSYTLNGLAGSLIVFTGIIIFLTSRQEKKKFLLKL